MVGRSALRGYLLEEIVAWMLQTSGYRLLTAPSDDPYELDSGPHGLVVAGRGAKHQADALGELLYVPPFSLPLRMFIEAKYRTSPVGLDTVRNAHGVIHDVNESYARSKRGWRPRQRYRYLYALFSTSGFSSDAQEFALAHQIVLVDLSTPAFRSLRLRIDTATEGLRSLAYRLGLSTVPVDIVRRQLRASLKTSDEATHRPSHTLGRAAWADESSPIIDQLTSFVLEDWRARILLGFPAAPLILALTTSNIESVIGALREAPVQSVRLHHQTDHAGVSTYAAVPVEGQNFELLFTLPHQIEAWIAEDPDERRYRRASVKSAYLSDITVVYAEESQTHIFKLLYEPGSWISSR